MVASARKEVDTEKVAKEMVQQEVYKASGKSWHRIAHKVEIQSPIRYIARKANSIPTHSKKYLTTANAPIQQTVYCNANISNSLFIGLIFASGSQPGNN